MNNLINSPRGRRFIVPALLLALIVGALPSRSTPSGVSTSTVTAVVGAGDPALPRGARVLGPLPSSTPLRLVVGLAPRRQQALDLFLRGRADRGSPFYRRTLSPGEYARLFSPSAGEERAVAAYLEAHGLRVVRHYRDRLLLDVAGTAGRVEDAFGVPIVRYRDRAGRARYANSARPRLPATLARLVTAVVGLRDAATPRHAPLPRGVVVAPARGRIRPRRARGVPPPPSTLLTPARIQAAYDIAPLYTTVVTAANGLTTTMTITGGGQTIALYELSPFKQEDIAAYDAAFNIVAAPPVNIPVDGGATNSYSEAGAQETALDIELAQAVAPGARILVYNGPADANSANTAAADDTYARIIDDNKAQVLSTSWGQCEDEQQADQPPDLKLLHNLFAQAAAQGMTVVAASGDNGAYDCMGADGTTPDTTKRAVDYPASDPYVLAVGGTRLALAAGGGIASEQGWAQSGGGNSNLFDRPAWQAGPGVDNALSNGERQAPDVALNAGAGYDVWLGGAWQTGGVGTSAGTPIWAALLALGNQLRYATAAAAGAPPPTCVTLPGLGDVHQALYQLAAAPAIPGGPGAFRDITVGSSNGVATPGPGWDYVTGLGVPDANVLLPALAALPALAPPAPGACPPAPVPATPTAVPTSARTPHPPLTPTAVPIATRAPSPTPTLPSTPPVKPATRLVARVVPGQVSAGAEVTLEVRGAVGRGLKVTFELDYPARPQRVYASTDRSGAATARVRVTRDLAGRRALLVHVRAIVQENRRTVSAQATFVVVQAPIRR